MVYGALKWTKKFVYKYGEERSIVRFSLQSRKEMKKKRKKRNELLKGFTQNGCDGNQPRPFEVGFYSIDTNTTCSFTKQDLTVK